MRNRNDSFWTKCWVWSFQCSFSSWIHRLSDVSERRAIRFSSTHALHTWNRTAASRVSTLDEKKPDVLGPDSSTAEPLFESVVKTFAKAINVFVVRRGERCDWRGLESVQWRRRRQLHERPVIEKAAETFALLAKSDRQQRTQSRRSAAQPLNLIQQSLSHDALLGESLSAIHLSGFSARSLETSSPQRHIPTFAEHTETLPVLLRPPKPGFLHNRPDVVSRIKRSSESPILIENQANITSRTKTCNLIELAPPSPISETPSLMCRIKAPSK